MAAFDPQNSRHQKIPLRTPSENRVLIVSTRCRRGRKYKEFLLIIIFKGKKKDIFKIFTFKILGITAFPGV